MAIPEDKVAVDTNEKSFSSGSIVEDKTDFRSDVEALSLEDDSNVLHNERDIATHVISVEDDPTQNPWTFRAFFLGLALSAFGGVLAEIYYFKPVSSMQCAH